MAHGYNVRKSEAPVSEGLLAATQRRDVSRFRVCRGVLQAAPSRRTAARAVVGERAGLGARRAVALDGALVGRPVVLSVLALEPGVGELGLLGGAGADMAEVVVVRDLAANLGAHLEPPCSETVTGGIL